MDHPCHRQSARGRDRAVPATRRALEGGRRRARRHARQGRTGTINFRTDDLDSTFEKVAAAPGVEVLEEPTKQFWGARDFAVRDLAGNTIRIEQA